MIYLKRTDNVYYVINNKLGGDVPTKVVLKNCASGEKTILEVEYKEIGSKYEIKVEIGNLPSGDYEFKLYDKCDFLLYSSIATTIYEKEYIPTVVNDNDTLVFFNNK